MDPIKLPQFTLQPQAAKELGENHSSEVGDVLTATVTLRVCGVASDDKGKKITVEVVELTDIKAQEFMAMRSDQQYDQLREESTFMDAGQTTHPPQHNYGKP